VTVNAGLVGFLIGASLPAAWGISMLVQIDAYNAAHPLGPNEAGRGMGMLGALAMIFVVAPILGTISGATSWLAAIFVRKVRGMKNHAPGV